MPTGYKLGHAFFLRAQYEVWCLEFHVLNNSSFHFQHFFKWDWNQNLSHLVVSWPWGITPSKICRILHIQWKPNLFNNIVLLVIQTISPYFKEFRHFTLFLLLTKNNTTTSPGFLGQWFNNLQWAELLTSFWCCGSVWQNVRYLTFADCRLQATDYRLYTVDLRP